MNWLHRLLNPHCPECAVSKLEDKICESCESKNQEIARLVAENERLLNHILNPVPKQNLVPEIPDSELKPILPNKLSWPARRRILEENDRAKARAMAEAPKPDKKVEELEKVLLDTSIPTEVALTENG